jgi:hypothetical protein
MARFRRVFWPNGNEALRRVQDVEQRIDQHNRQQAAVDRPTREDFESLGSDLETVWNSPSTDARLKKRIVRTLIHEVIADLDRDQGALMLVIHWKGGIHTELRLRHRRRGQNSAQTSKDVVEAVRVLARVCSDELLAGVLTRSGLRTGRGNRWTKERVTSLRSHHEIPSPSWFAASGQISLLSVIKCWISGCDVRVNQPVGY